MKKLLFAALLATVSVGGAFAQGYYSAGSNVRDIMCDGIGINCSMKYGVSWVYTVPFSSGLQGAAGTIIDTSFLEAEL